jgi:hypothetical protein
MDQQLFEEDFSNLAEQFLEAEQRCTEYQTANNYGDEWRKALSEGNAIARVIARRVLDHLGM